MLWIKICGVKDPRTASVISSLGADAIGLNFYAHSPRSVQPETAREIIQGLPGTTTPVGLFVNHSPEFIRETTSLCRIRTVQLHGDESPDFLAKLPALQIIWARRLTPDQLPSLAPDIDRSRNLGVNLLAILLDAPSQSSYGGTGLSLDWSALQKSYDFQHWPPLILAGGLNPENVASAVSAVRPWGIDVASGVESSPGVKDLQRIEQFIQRARAAHNTPT